MRNRMTLKIASSSRIRNRPRRRRRRPGGDLIAPVDPTPVERVEVGRDLVPVGTKCVDQALPGEVRAAGAVAAEHGTRDQDDPLLVLALHGFQQRDDRRVVRVVHGRRIEHPRAQLAHVVGKVGEAALEGLEKHGLAGRRVAANAGLLIDLRALEVRTRQLRLPDPGDFAQDAVEAANESRLGRRGSTGKSSATRPKTTMSARSGRSVRFNGTRFL